MFFLQKDWIVLTLQENHLTFEDFQKSSGNFLNIKNFKWPKKLSNLNSHISAGLNESELCHTTGLKPGFPGGHGPGTSPTPVAGIHKNNRSISWRNLLALAHPSMFFYWFK